MGQKLKDSDNHHHLQNTLHLTKNHILFLIFVQLYFSDHLLSFQPLYVLFYLKKLFYINFLINHQNAFSAKSSIAAKVAKLACFNLAAKLSAVN